MEGSWALVALAGLVRLAAQAARLTSSRASAAQSRPRLPSRARPPASGSCRGITLKAAPIRSATARRWRANGPRRPGRRSPGSAPRSRPAPTLVVMKGSSHQFSVSRTARRSPGAAARRRRRARPWACGRGCRRASARGRARSRPSAERPEHLHAEGRAASSRLEPATPQGGEGASSTSARRSAAAPPAGRPARPSSGPAAPAARAAPRRAWRCRRRSRPSRRPSPRRAGSPAPWPRRSGAITSKPAASKGARKRVERPAAAEGAVHHDDGSSVSGGSERSCAAAS